HRIRRQDWLLGKLLVEVGQDSRRVVHHAAVVLDDGDQDLAALLLDDPPPQRMNDLLAKRDPFVDERRAHLRRRGQSVVRVKNHIVTHRGALYQPRPNFSMRRYSAARESPSACAARDTLPLCSLSARSTIARSNSSRVQSPSALTAAGCSGTGAPSGGR